MDEHFICRNGHQWRLSLDEPMGINPRWVHCPVCGTSPMPAACLSLWERLGRWTQRNPAAVGLLASMLVLLAGVGSVARMQWRDMTTHMKRLEAEAEDLRQQALQARTPVATQHKTGD
jgi:hypothetical protein